MYCGERFEPDLLTVDHVQARMRGGDRSGGNLVTACGACNARKGSMRLAEFLRAANVTNVFIGGLATDYCVKYTALDARQLRFDTTVLENDDVCGALEGGASVRDDQAGGLLTLTQPVPELVLGVHVRAVHQRAGGGRERRRAAGDSI